MADDGLPLDFAREVAVDVEPDEIFGSFDSDLLDLAAVVDAADDDDDGVVVVVESVDVLVVVGVVAVGPSDSVAFAIDNVQRVSLCGAAGHANFCTKSNDARKTRWNAFNTGTSN